MKRPGRGLVRAGAIVSALTLVLPILWVPALVIGIVLLVRRRIRAGVLVLVLGVFVLPAISLALYTAFVLKPYRVPSEAMSPELEREERFIALKLGGTPGVGDIAVFRPPQAALQADDACGEDPARGAMCARSKPGLSQDVEFVKRVVAVGGDRITMEGGRIIRNGRPEPGRPLGDCTSECDFPEAITVPDGHLYMLGDNRGASDDSRFWGPVPEDAVTGRYWFTYRGG